MGFYVGQLVVCVDDVFCDLAYQWCTVLPVKGRIYTVREFKSSIHWVYGGPGCGVKLAELVNPPSWIEKEPFFSASRFKPYEGSVYNIEEQEDFELLEFKEIEKLLASELDAGCRK